MKKFKVELSSLGLESKTVNYNDYQWTLYQGQIIKESALTKNFPQFFVELKEGEEVTPAPVVETPEITEEVVEEVVETPEITEEVVEEVVETPEITEEVVEEVEAPAEETTEEVVEETTEKSVDEVLAEAKAIRTKAELEEYGFQYGIDLNKQKSLKNMLKDLEAHIKG